MAGGHGGGKCRGVCVNGCESVWISCSLEVDEEMVFEGVTVLSGMCIRCG